MTRATAICARAIATVRAAAGRSRSMDVEHERAAQARQRVDVGGRRVLHGEALERLDAIETAEARGNTSGATVST